MTRIGSYEAKTHLSQLLKRVARGEEILITKRGEPIAVLAPPPRAARRDIRSVIEAFKAYSTRAGRTLKGTSARELVEEGRRY